MRNLTLLWIITVSSCCFGMKEEEPFTIKKDVTIITGNDNQETVISSTIANQIPAIYNHFSDFPLDESLIYQIPYTKASTLKKMIDLLSQYQKQGGDQIDPHMQELIDNVEIARKKFHELYRFDDEQRGHLNNALTESGWSDAVKTQVKYRIKIDESPKKSLLENECDTFSFIEMIDIIGTADFLGLDNLVNPLFNIACLKKITANDVLNSNNIMCPQELLIRLNKRALKPSVIETVPVGGAKITFSPNGKLMGIQDYRPGWFHTVTPTVQVWDTQKKKIIKTVKHATNMAFDEEGKYLACDIQPSFGNGPMSGMHENENNDFIEIYDINTWKLNKKVPFVPTQPEYPDCVIYIPNEEMGVMIPVSKKGPSVFSAYSLKKENLRQKWEAIMNVDQGTRKIFGRRNHFNEKKSIVGFIDKLYKKESNSYIISLWDTIRDVCIKTVPVENDKKFRVKKLKSCSFSSQADLFAASGSVQDLDQPNTKSKGLLKIWDTETWQCIHTIIDKDSTVLDNISFNPNGGSIATVAYTADRSCVKLWGPLYANNLDLQQLAFCIHYAETNAQLTSELKPFYDEFIPENIKKNLGAPRWINVKFTRPFKPLQSLNSINKRSEASKVLLGSQRSSQALAKEIEKRNTIGQRFLRLIKWKN